MKDRIKNLLINGMKPAEIASTVGCSPSYISQLVKDEEFKKNVEEGMLAIQMEKTEEDHIDTRYQNLQHKLITAAEEAMAEASLGELSRAMEVIHKREDMRLRRKAPAPPSGPTVNINVVSLQLPTHALALDNKPLVTLNEKQEIIAIGNRALAPMSSEGVKNLFSERQRLQTIDAEVAKEL